MSITTTGQSASSNAKQAWLDYGSGGLEAVLDALQDKTQETNYDFEQVKGAVLGHSEYQYVYPEIPVGSWINPDVWASMVHGYTLANIHVALAAGLTGYEKVIAVTDNGFYLDHPDLTGKTIWCYSASGREGSSTCPEEDHGTATSVIAAGNLNNDGLMGVAPDADLLLMYWGLDLDDQVERARERGAVSWNNSWGWCFGDCDTAPPITEDNLAEFDQYLHNAGAYRLSEQADLYDDYQDTGVIVFARSNDQSYSPDSEYYDFPADLPALYPELQEAWITAANAHFYTDPETDEIVSVWRVSSACGYSNAWCLTGTGTMRVANDSEIDEDDFVNDGKDEF